MRGEFGCPWASLEKMEGRTEVQLLPRCGLRYSSRTSGCGVAYVLRSLISQELPRSLGHGRVSDLLISAAMLGFCTWMWA